MLTQCGANFVAVHSVVRQFKRRRFGILLGGVAFAAVTLGGCVRASVPLIGPDPADPSVKVARVGYRSTIAPYTSLRPTAPAPWRQQNERVTPAPKSGR